MSRKGPELDLQWPGEKGSVGDAGFTWQQVGCYGESGPRLWFYQGREAQALAQANPGRRAQALSASRLGGCWKRRPCWLGELGKSVTML